MNQRTHHEITKELTAKTTILLLHHTSELCVKVSVFGVFLVRKRENMDQKNSEYGHLSRSETNGKRIKESHHVPWHVCYNRLILKKLSLHVNGKIEEVGQTVMQFKIISSFKSR